MEEEEWVGMRHSNIFAFREIRSVRGFISEFGLMNRCTAVAKEKFYDPSF
jgi:hypothetical protein